MQVPVYHHYSITDPATGEHYEFADLLGCVERDAPRPSWWARFKTSLTHWIVKGARA